MYPRGYLLVAAAAVVISTGCKRKSAGQSVIHRTGEPDVAVVDAEDAEMNAAILQAQQTTKSFLQILVAPMPNQTDFSVKRPYPAKGSSDKEHIWISHLSFDGNLLHGTIENDPVGIEHLQLGDPVSFPPAELSDWMYLEDGKIVGGYTTRVSYNHMTAAEKADFDRRLHFKK